MTSRNRVTSHGRFKEILPGFLRRGRVVSKATLETAQDIKKLLYDQEIDRWLAKDQLRHQTQYHAELREHRANEACMDFLAEQRFTSWYEDPEPSQLAIFGEMGSGKTMTMSFILDELCRRSRSQIPQSKVCYYYCRNDETGRTLQILLALTLALLEQLPGLKKTFYDWYKKHQASSMIHPGTDASKLTEFLTGIVGTLERPLYFVIDGLEECDRQSQHGVLEILKDLQRNTPKVKSVVSSRPQQEMFAQIGAKYQVHLSPNARRDEILTRYMVTSGLPDLSEDVQTYLIGRLSRMACGSAIWLKMMVDLIACHRISQIGPMKRFFDGGSLPRTLTHVYENPLSRYASDDAENLNLAKTALKMLAVASRPLSISELSWAVALARILSLISPFVSSIDFGDINRHQVRVAHQSVKDFVMEHLSPELTSCDSTIHRPTANDSSQELNAWAFNICTAYLLLDEVGQSDLFSDELTAIEALPPEIDLFEEETESTECNLSCTWETWEESMICYDPIERGFGGFLVYSSCYWLNYLAETTTELDSCLERVEGICRAGSPRLRNWIQQYRRPGCTIQPRFLFEDELYDPLSIICLFGSESILWHVLANADFCKDVYHPHSARRAGEQLLQWGDLGRIPMLAVGTELWSQISKAQLSWLVISQWSIQDSTRRDWNAVFDLLRRKSGGLGPGPSAEELKAFALQRNCPTMGQLYDSERRPWDLRVGARMI